tara:strand:- start:105 stop:221 length:117 start_codon:yes stop_codon:yes gene_type:complete
MRAENLPKMLRERDAERRERDAEREMLPIDDEPNAHFR